MADAGLRHFLDLSELDASILRSILDDAAERRRTLRQVAQPGAVPARAGHGAVFRIAGRAAARCRLRHLIDRPSHARSIAHTE